MQEEVHAEQSSITVQEDQQDCASCEEVIPYLVAQAEPPISADSFDESNRETEIKVIIATLDSEITQTEALLIQDSVLSKFELLRSLQYA